METVANKGGKEGRNQLTMEASAPKEGGREEGRKEGREGGRELAVVAAAAAVVTVCQQVAMSCGSGSSRCTGSSL